MIKVKVNNEYKDVVKIFCGGTLQKEITKVWSREAQDYVYESSVEYTGSLPITISANGDALLDYRIYGADGGVGEATENLFDPNAKNVDNGYIDKAVISSIEDRITTNIYWAYVTEYIPVDGNTEYIMFMNLYRASTDYATGIAFYDKNKNFISSIRGCVAFQKVTYEVPLGGMKSFTTPESCRYIRTNVDTLATMLMLVAASTPPPAYIPYGYKLPMTVYDGETTQTVPVYIGENQLDAISEYSDYVDKASGKIVRYIKEYTFTGKEAFLAAYGYAMRFVNPKFNDANSDPEKITCFSNFFNAIPNDTINYFNLYAPDGSIGFRRNDDEIVLKDSTKFTTTQECINYLKSQYDNGTPVKFWYVLEIPIEEDPPVPLPEIPTIDGTTVIDYDRDPKPSQMYIKYRR